MRRPVIRWPWPLGNPTPFLEDVPGPIKPQIRLGIADCPVQLTCKLSADAFNVDSDGVQLHCPKPPHKPRITARAAYRPLLAITQDDTGGFFVNFIQ